MAAADGVAPEAGRFKLNAALTYLLEQKGVPAAFQDALGDAGFITMGAFSNLEDDRAGLRRILAAEFGLDPALDPVHRRSQAAVLEAWEAAADRAAAERKEEAVARATRLPRSVTSNEHLAMRRAFELRWHALEDEVAASDTYVEGRLEQIEDGEFRAETLSQVTAKSQQDDGHLSAHVELSGVLRVRKGSFEIPMPRNGEELRSRLGTLAACWMYAGLRHSGNPKLAGLSPQDFHAHADYVLGGASSRT